MAATRLDITHASAGNRQTMTFSFWSKISSLVNPINSSYYFPIFHMNVGSDYILIYLNSGDNKFGVLDSNGTDVKTTRVFRDVNAWYHFVVAIDTTQATASDRIKIYVNGVQETSFTTSTYPSQNANMSWNNNNLNSIGQHSSATDYYYLGLLSHVHFIDGTQYQASDFGEYDANGVWKIKTSPSVTYGTNGFFILKDGNSVTDQSGNGNNLSLATGSLVNTEDNPSNVFANWNFLSSPSNGNIGDVTGSNGNTTTSYFAQYRSYPATLGFKSGKFYWEVKRKTTSNDCHLGLVSENLTPVNQATWFGNTPNGWTYAGDGGDLYHNGSNPGSSGYATFTTNDIIGVAYDADNGKLFFSKNGTWQNSSDPANGTNPAFSSLDTSLFYFPGIVAGADTDTNFGNGYFGTQQVSSAGTNASGNGIFEFDCPDGYTALSTKGLNL